MILRLAWCGITNETWSIFTPASSSAWRLISSIERTATLKTSLPFMVIVCSLFLTVSGLAGFSDPPAGT